MRTLLIEPHYLGSIEYFSLLSQYDSIILEVTDRFPKQTYRNRCYLLGSNRVLMLTIPVNFSSRTITKDVTIDQSQRWRKDHWGAFFSSYGKAPFFEYFADDIREVWEKPTQYMVDLLVRFLEIFLKFLRKSATLALSTSVENLNTSDLRNVILPKQSFTDRGIYRAVPYNQSFGTSFTPNLSILDLLMNEGPRAEEILSASFLTT